MPRLVAGVLAAGVLAGRSGSGDQRPDAVTCADYAVANGTIHVLGSSR